MQRYIKVFEFQIKWLHLSQPNIYNMEKIGLLTIKWYDEDDSHYVIKSDNERESLITALIDSNALDCETDEEFRDAASFIVDELSSGYASRNMLRGGCGIKYDCICVEVDSIEYIKVPIL